MQRQVTDGLIECVDLRVCLSKVAHLLYLLETKIPHKETKEYCHLARVINQCRIDDMGQLKKFLSLFPGDESMSNGDICYII